VRPAALSREARELILTNNCRNCAREAKRKGPLWVYERRAACVSHRPARQPRTLSRRIRL